MWLTGDWISRPATQDVCSVFSAAGHQIMFVGGCVRNALLEAPVLDIDLATNARPETIINLCQMAGFKVIPSGLEHGTVTVVSKGLAHEVTSFRRDVATDGRHAVVAFSDKISEDAQRRDFTMNALYVTPHGKVVDPLGGLPDLKARRVRFIENAGRRIQEDYLRILRFFRFSAIYGDPKIGFDPDALAAIEQNLHGLLRLSRERVGFEIKKLLAAIDPAPALDGMRTTGVLSTILPSADDRTMAPLVHFEQLYKIAPDPIRRLAALVSNNISDVSAALRLSKAETRQHTRLVAAVSNMQSTATLAYRLGAAGAWDVLVLRAALLESPIDPSSVEQVARGTAACCPVQSSDLISFFKGAALGQALKDCEARWIASEFQLTKKALLAIYK